MGRLGGQELGYGSDADVLFVYDEVRPATTAASATASQRRTRWPSDCARMLAAPATDPPLFLDADLRPRAAAGRWSARCASYAEYYARWSSVWEAQALLRARFCVGDPELGERFIELIDPCATRPAACRRPMRCEIRRHQGPGRRRTAAARRRPAHPHQARPRRPGRHRVDGAAAAAAARLPGARAAHHGERCAALLAAADAGLLSADQAAALEAAWRLAGRTRDAIMLVRDKSEGQLPKPGRVLAAVGRVLGYRPGFEAGQLIDDYRRVTRRARSVVEAVFYDSVD